MAKIGKGVVVEFDFAVLNGAEILFETASGILKGHGIALDSRLEALHLAGGNYQGALAELFAKVDRHRGNAVFICLLYAVNVNCKS